jgi:hypothetical protein
LYPPHRKIEVRRQLIFPRRGEKYLPFSQVQDPPSQALLPFAVQLGKHVVQEEGGGRRAGSFQGGQLE